MTAGSERTASRVEEAPSPAGPQAQPGWPEIVVALAVYLLLVAALGLWMVNTSEEQAALRGIVGMAANGAIGCIALLAAVGLRIRRFDAFGFRAAGLKWLAAGVALGVVAFGLSFIVEAVYFHFITDVNTQADFQAAAAGGTLSLLVLLVAGALLTPFGEEVVFRGVIATVLNRHGAWAGVLGSAVIFAAAHGPSVIFFDALMVGILIGTLYRKTRSLWPALAVHVVYNGLHLLDYSRL